MPVFKVVYGAPCSGKSTLVKALLKDDDIRFDYDLIMQSISNKQSHKYSNKHLPFVIAIRKLLIDKSKSSNEIETVYIIATKITDKLIIDLKDIDVEYVLNEKSKKECYKLLEKDKSRGDKQFWKSKIDDWFSWYDKFKNQKKKKVKRTKNLITKGAKVGKLESDEKELKLINKYTLEPLTAEQVFTLKIGICDNKVDRDFEVFPRKSLNKMAKLFIGKTIIKDHSGKSDNQVARIYDTEIVEENYTTKNGETYAKLVAHCYMVRTDSNKDLITEIQAGIKKEVSVKCSIGKVVCSICGIDNRQGDCRHWGGREYDGKQCYFKLENPVDAYEVSFVAVPAQPNAGVIKNYTGKEKTYQEENQHTEKEDLINTELGITKSFIFTEKERENEYE